MKYFQCGLFVYIDIFENYVTVDEKYVSCCHYKDCKERKELHPNERKENHIGWFKYHIMKQWELDVFFLSREGMSFSFLAGKKGVGMEPLEGKSRSGLLWDS